MQARDVTFSVADPDVDIVGGFPDGPVTPPSLTWVAPSPASGATGVASGNFIATLLHGTASVTVTPSSDKAGTWAPTSRTLTPEAATGNFTFTASEAGFHSVTLTNDAGISAPAAVTFTATEVPALAFVAPDTATAGVTFQATIAASGAASGPWSLNVPSGWTVSPSSGSSVAPGSPVSVSITGTEGTQSLTLTCAGADITGNPQSVVVSPAAPSGSITIVETGATYGTLAAAIAAAVSGQTITIPAATTLAEAGLNIGAKSLTIKSATTGAQVVIDGTTLTAPGGGYVLAVNGGALALIDVRLTGNKHAGQYNAGLATLSSGGLVSLLRCEIDECNNGILHGDGDTTTTWMLVDSKFHDNGDWDGLSHNIYIGKSPSVTMRGCWSYHSKMRQDYTAGEEWRESWGHLVKSRSKVMLIEACRLTMERLSTVGGANRCVDYPCGGDLTIVGSLLEYRTRQNSGQGQAISWGINGAERIPGTTFDGREFKIKIRQNTIVARSPDITLASNKDVLWVGEGCISDGAWPNDAPTPAPSEFDVVDNIFCGWDDTPPRVLEGPSAVASTTYAISAATNTVGALALLTDATTYDYLPVSPVAGSTAWTTYAYAHPASTVARSDSDRGAVYQGWGTGASTGTYSAGLWTPARDGSGKVNAASWAIVPNDSTQWVAVASTRLDALNADVLAAIPGWVNRGADGWNGVLFDWVGMANDLRAGREKSYVGPGGGHSGGTNDGIYAFDWRKMQWEIELLPSDPAYWDVNYTAAGTGNNLTIYPLADAYKTANPTNVLGVWSDEFFDPSFPSDPNRSSRRPTARHTYQSQVFVPTLGAAGKILMGCRRFWVYDIATKTWALPVFPISSATPGTFGPATGYTQENMNGWFDASDGRYYVCATFNGGSSETYSILPDGTGGTLEGNYPTGGYVSQHCAQEDDDTYLWTLRYWNSATGTFYGRPYTMVRTTKATGAQTTYSISVGSSMSGLAFTFTSGWDGMGMTYVPTVGKWLVLVNPDSGGQKFCWLDPATWTLELGPNTGLPTVAGGDFRLQNKVKWLPGIGAVVLPATADANVRLLKP